MATSSLTKLTVPLASDQSSPSQGLLMPKLAYRFRVNFLGFGINKETTELTKQVMDFKRPNVTFADIDVPIYNSTIKLAGKYTWDNTTCTIRDDASGSVTKLVGEQLQKQLDFMEQSSAAAGIDYKFTTVFQVLDGGNGASVPVVLEEWSLLGCYLQGVDYGSTDYATNEVMKLALTIRFDNALQTIGGGVGVPTPVSSQRVGGAATG